MNIVEFRALKEGSRIRNAMTDSSGTIVSAEDHRGKIIVEVQWDGTNMVLGHFSETSTAWMHWALESPVTEGEAAEWDKHPPDRLG